MKKKHYQSPRLKVREYKMKRQMLCNSIPTSLKNESYEEVSEETTDTWFN